MKKNLSQPQIIDYEKSQYRTDFWEGQGREYEDLAERSAIKSLLPSSGKILMEAGAGFGRLAELYEGYDKVVLVDYSLSLLQEAQRLWGDDPRFVFVAASLYDLPFADRILDSLVMIRVMHHLQNPSLALTELARILNGNGVFILEYANKRNLKAIIRYMTRRQSWSPFDPQPYEFVHLNFDFHPSWMNDVLNKSGLEITKELAISSFRLSAIKRNISPSFLARLDTKLASPGAQLKLSPSVLLRCEKSGAPGRTSLFFQCPVCSATDFQKTPTDLACKTCNRQWHIIDGIYDFRVT